MTKRVHVLVRSSSLAESRLVKIPSIREDNRLLDLYDRLPNDAYAEYDRVLIHVLSSWVSREMAKRIMYYRIVKVVEYWSDIRPDER